MKLIKTTTLVFAEGRSEKVYSVDLCEVGAGQFVVNFRYGKRGGPLKDGSKTAMPVKQAEAERIFDKLVQQQVEKGYFAEGTPRPAPPAAVAAAPPTPAAAGRSGSPRGPGELANDPQKSRILERLAQTGTNRRWFKREGHEKTWNLERAIWRAGELRIREAEPHLLRLVGTAPVSAEPKAGGRGIRDYCIAWALGRLGTEASVDALTKLYRDPNAPGHVQRIATLALVALSDDASRKEFAEHMVAALPEPLRASAGGTDPDAFARALRGHLAADANAWGAVDVAYVIDGATVRPAILAELAEVPLAAPYFYFVRHVLKAAEYRRDGRVYGLLARRIEKTRANFAHANYAYARQSEKRGYGGHTRRYLRHRIWRTLRRAGRDGDLDYVKLAVGVLLAFTDADAAALLDPNRYEAWASYLAFSHILFENASGFTPTAGRNGWRLKRGSPATPPADVRPEAFPKLWEARPEGLMHLLAESDCTPVHTFAAKAMRAVPAFLDQLDVDDVLVLLGKRFEPTARLGLELAEKRYDANAPNMALLAGMARSSYAPARARAIQWLDAQRTRVLADTALVAALTVAPHADTRDFARRLLRSSILTPEVGIALVARVVAAMVSLSTADADADGRARDATQTLLLAVSAHLGGVSAAVMKDLLAHPLAGVQELGAELLLRAASGPDATAIPDDVMVQILHSQHDNVRAVGLRLLAELSDATLAKMELLLVRLSVDKNADLRNASRPIVARVAAAFPAAGETIARALLESLLRRKLPDDVPAHVARMLREELFAFAAHLDPDDMWRLLRSASPHAQELGGLLLQRTDSAALDLPRVVELASHEILAVRQAAWKFFEENEPRVRAGMAEASRILDAKWEDSRTFAFEYFRSRLGAEAFSADVLVTILDSVRADVQAFGRELAQKHFKDDDGPTLMTRLAEHPTVAVQVFTTNYLTRFAADRPGRIEAMVPYFTTVLSRVNQGRIAKQRVLAFLEAEGAKNPETASVVVAILHRISATVSVESRGATIAAMVAIHHAQPGVALPLRIKSPPKRGPGGIPVLV